MIDFEIRTGVDAIAAADIEWNTRLELVFERGGRAHDRGVTRYGGGYAGDLRKAWLDGWDAAKDEAADAGRSALKGDG